MSEVKQKLGQRYALATPRGEHLAGWWSIKIGMTTSEAGDYVLASDYAALQSQNAELVEALARLARQEMGATALSELIARYERAELSEGQLCKLLGIDRIEVRALVDAHRAALSKVSP